MLPTSLASSFILISPISISFSLLSNKNKVSSIDMIVKSGIDMNLVDIHHFSSSSSQALTLSNEVRSVIS